MSDKNKKKKQKTIYIDDGRTIFDMSAFDSRSGHINPDIHPPKKLNSTMKEKLETYFSAVKMMFLPMLATMGIITAAFLILYLILELAS